MSKADEMFEKLGYMKSDMLKFINVEKWGEKFYNKNNLVEISFDFEDKEIAAYCEETSEAVYFHMEELQAINEKCKELGWL